MRRSGYGLRRSRRPTACSGSWATILRMLRTGLGCTPVTANSDGTLKSTLRFKTWGEVRYSSGATNTNYTFTGQYSYTADFGLLYFGARFYDPLLGRFAQADPIIPGAGLVQALDRYAGLLENPVRYTDPSGHRPCEDYDNGRCISESGWQENIVHDQPIILQRFHSLE
jgi:RHS repeat-associated protein